MVVGDLQALGVEQLLADSSVADLLEHLTLDQALGAGRALAAVVDLGERDVSGVLHRRARGLIQRACRHHAVEHVIPAGLRACRVGLGIEERRKLDRRRQDGAFFDGQLVNGLTEVSLGCCADAVRTATEVNGVQIRGEDVVLGPLVGHLRGDDEFLHLSRQRTLRADKRLLDVLLRDGRATTGAVATEDVVTGCACETGDREARIRVEIAVLCGQNSVANVRAVPDRARPRRGCHLAGRQC